jgi:lipopolysaccharide/colanic/teichoic acid biosynthesis glycosyltransferase
MYIIFIKPALDFLVALLIIIVLSPVILILWLLVYFILGSPVLFSQKRPGKEERIFTLHKFRTMNNTRDSQGVLLPDAERLTRLGRFLRKTSLDEIPQFLDVVKGNLSIIGPRPLLVEYLEFYNEEQRRRHKVKPGITGWAQINGRNQITWEDKFRLDLFYVDNISFKLDIKILFKTIIQSAKGSGIYNNYGLTMDKFSGNKQ